MVQADTDRSMVLDWFENDFKETAKSTTKTSRLDDGKVSYSFSVVNNSGMDFDRFSFRVKILNKANGQEIGSSTIRTGQWSSGEKKNFRSKIALPQDVRSISFVMYSESVDYDGRRADSLGQSLREVGDMITGADGSGGVFGELFSTGGMPETTVTQTTTTRMPGGATTTKTTTTRTRSDGSRTSRTETTRRTPSQSRQQSRSAGSQGSTVQGIGQSYAKRKSDKKLNKIRLGKSPGGITALVFGVICLIIAVTDSSSSAELLEFLMVGGGLSALGGYLMYRSNTTGKRIRAYEARFNKNGNTPIDDLAADIGRSPEKVMDDLQKFITMGFFPNAYVDAENRLLVMTRNGKAIVPPDKTAAENKKARRKAAREKGVVPDSIDDLITMTDDTEIKDKLKNLRAISSKIDKRIEERPDLTDQVKEFREKFYPEVVRLTDAYNEKIADLSSDAYAARTQGELEINASPDYLQKQARDIKVQLIKLIDSVTEASENLFERLHEDDLMDISSDIQMLQTTLAGKGLLDSDFDISL